MDTSILWLITATYAVTFLIGVVTGVLVLAAGITKAIRRNTEKDLRELNELLHYQSYSAPQNPPPPSDVFPGDEWKYRCSHGVPRNQGCKQCRQ